MSYATKYGNALSCETSCIRSSERGTLVKTFLLRHGRRPSERMTAVTIVAEGGRVSRVAKARQLMGYSGAVAGENSGGERTRRGGITKTGNAHLRRALVEVAWCQRHAPNLTRSLRKRREGLGAAVQEIAAKARHRLTARSRRLLARGKTKQQVVTAIARELLGFVWAIGVEGERHGCAGLTAA